MQPKGKIENMLIKNLTQEQPYKDPIKNPNVIESGSEQKKADNRSKNPKDNKKNTKSSGNKQSKDNKHNNSKVNGKVNSKQTMKEKTQEEELKDALKDQAKKSIESNNKLNTLIEKSQRELLSLSGFWPFDLWADRLVVDELNISHVNRTFPFIQTVQSVPLKSVKEEIVTTGILFGSLTIKGEKELKINFLKTSDAVKARRVIHGLRLIVNESIDTSKLAKEELIKKAEELGKVSEVS